MRQQKLSIAGALHKTDPVRETQLTAKKKPRVDSTRIGLSERCLLFIVMVLDRFSQIKLTKLNRGNRSFPVHAKHL